MRVVQFIESGGPGGAEHVMLSLASNLKDRGHDLLVIPPYDGYVSEKCRERKIPHLILQSTRHLDVSLVRRLRRAVADFGGHIIHAHGLDAAVYASLAGLGKVPVVATLHGSLRLHHAEPLRLWAKRRILRATGLTLTTVSRQLRAEVIENALLDQDRVVAIYNGVDFANGQACLDPQALRVSLGIPVSATVIGMVANARPEKGHQRFLNAAAAVAYVRPGTHFVLAGRLPGGSEMEIRRRIQEMRLQNCVHVLGFRDDVQRVFAMLDIFILASDSEGFSLATVEAMGFGKPVVVTRCGGPEEIIEDGRTGLLTDIDEGSAIAARVLWLLNHPIEARHIATRGCEAVRARFDIGQMVAAYERLYSRLTQNTTRKAA